MKAVSPSHPHSNSTPDSPPNPTPTTRRLPAWAPLRAPLFRALWLASLASNIGTWMHEVGAAWLMTSLSTDAQLNALVAAAGSLPMFLLALPAGALADIIDRRKLMIATQTWALVVTGTLAGLTFAGLVTPAVLLFFTLLMALGSALSAPAWQSIVPEIVKKNSLPAAIALGGVSWNMARVLGPTLGGVLIGFLAPKIGNIQAPGAVFALNALSFSGVVVFLISWKRKAHNSDLPPEHLTGAIKTGLRFARHSPEMRAILGRIGGYILPSSALWALLPLHARTNLGLDATGYGSLLGFFGAGAIVSGIGFERLRARFSSDTIVKIASAGVGLSFLGLALVKNVWLARAMMFGVGLSWPLGMLTFQVAVLRNAPDWIRSRAASMFLLVFTGAMTLGAFGWGAIARQITIPLAFMLAAEALYLSIFAGWKAIIPEAPQNFSPSQHWPDPVIAREPAAHDGPVLITTEYQIEAENAREFVLAMQPVRLMRLRDGALRWNLFQDAAEPTRWLETMLVESWNEHLRQHTRVSLDSATLEAQAERFHQGNEAPRVSHLIAAKPGSFEDEGDD